MRCDEFLDFLMSYLDGELPSERRQVFDAHLAQCPDCVTYMNTYRETQRLEAQLLREPRGALVPAEVPDDPVQAILAARGR